MNEYNYGYMGLSLNLMFLRICSGKTGKFKMGHESSDILHIFYRMQEFVFFCF